LAKLDVWRHPSTSRFGILWHTDDARTAGIYETGRKATDVMKEVIRSSVQFGELLPKWNYTINPQITQ